MSIAAQKRSVSRKHDWVDERSRALHIIIAQKIRQEPTLLEMARFNLDRWEKGSSGEVKPIFAEWRAMIRDWSLQRLLDFLGEKSARANQMRQSSPFTGILTAAERNQVFAEYESL